MVEQQSTNKCQFCGYPIEIGEHAPDCPNNPKKEEDKEEAIPQGDLQPEVDRQELRNYTRQEHAEERQEVADKTRETRKQYFSRQQEVGEQLHQLEEQLEGRRESLDKLVGELQELENNISDKSSSLFTRVWEHFNIKKIEAELIGKKPDKEKLESEIEQLLTLQDELSQQLEDKQELSQIREQVDEFYNSHIDDFKKHQERERVAELERLEKEEEMRKVENIAAEHNGVFVHGIMDRVVPGSNSLIQTGVTFETKLKLAISLEPTISTSVIQKGDQAGAMWAQMGVVLSRGRVDAAHYHDAATRPQGLKKRSGVFDKDSIEQINNSVAGLSPDRYNEFIVSNPRVAGMYLSAYRHDYKTKIPDQEFFQLAQELNLPTFFVKDGEIFEIRLDEESNQLEVGERVDPATLGERVREFTDQEKEDILHDALEKEMPFDIERIVPEARHITCRANAAEEYMELMGNRLSETETGQNIKVNELELDAEAIDYEGRKKLSGDTVRVLKEVRHPSGKLNRYFENNGRVYKQSWDYQNRRFEKNFNKIDYPGKHTSSYIKVSYNTWQLDRTLRSPKDYLNGMANSIEQELKERAEVQPDDKRGQEYYHEILERLAFHLYGFAETAAEFGDTEIQQRALELAQKLKSQEDYQEVIDRRLDERGRFRITKEDLE